MTTQHKQRENREIGLHQHLKPLYFKGYHQKNEKTTHRMGKKYLQFRYLIRAYYVEYIKNSSLLMFDRKQQSSIKQLSFD